MTDEPLAQSNRLLSNPSASAGARVVEVQIDTVDDFCRDRRIERIDVLKADTEGYEMDVLRGARTLLSEKRVNFVLAECDFFRRPAEPHGDFFEIFNFLSPFGYNVVSLYTGGADDLGWEWGNVLFRQCSGQKLGRTSISPLRNR